MELNAEQIIKALECCAVNHNCSGCVYGMFPTLTNCIVFNMRNALALIKELAEESQKWQKAYDCADSACRELSSKCDELTEENERLRAENDELCDNIACLEIDLKNARTNTVRRMQERLKMCFGTYVLGYKIPLTETLKILDRIAKEMLEEK